MRRHPDGTSKTNDNPGVIAPPPLIFLGCIAGGYLLDSYWPWGMGFGALRTWVGVGLVAVGFVLSGWSVVEFIRYGTHPDPRHATTTIITTGPFRFSRNPIYAAFTLMHLGVALWVGKWWMLLTIIPAVALIRYGVVAREERYLERKFGEEYRDYRRQVRRWI